MDYIIEVRNKGEAHAGAKAPDDIAEICRRRGMKSFVIPPMPFDKNLFYRQFVLLIESIKVWIHIAKTVKNGDRVIWQHPAPGVRYANRFIPWIKKRKKVEFIALIHDLETLRDGIGQQRKSTAIIADLKLLPRFDYVISHNKFMSEYLHSIGISSEKIVNLEIFDYLYNEPVPEIIRNNGKKVIVAGNLTREKSGYVYKLKELNVDMCLYGVNYEGDIPDDIYKGAFSPDELIQHLEGNFGLVWDGTSVEKCTGNTGAYLKYNNPHKTSLYLAANLPVIIWSQAAMADFVKRNNIGIVIDDLHHLSESLKGVSEKDYQEMQQNVRMIGKKIRQGYYFNTALDALK
ncbi:hypothetical protein [Streptococcus mitis]|nr:hypothetical protein [Streptococcus mitis]